MQIQINQKRYQLILSTLDFTDSVTQTLPINPNGFSKRPYTCFVYDANLPAGERITNMTYTISSSTAPDINIVYSNLGVTRTVTIAVLYED